MRALFIGGTGLISAACSELAVARGVDLALLNRGRRGAIPAGAAGIVADSDDPAALRAALAGRDFDVVVNWIAFTPEQVERDIELFRGRVGQYIFISSASAYQRPVGHYLISESTPLANPYWEYSRNKIACEERLLRAMREEGFPVTIVRPSLTYGDTQIPLVMNSWQLPYTAIARMRAGKPVVVPGDGSSLWPITHNSDFAKGFVGLMGHQQALGHAFHITSDEALTWDQHYAAAAAAAGVEAKIVHIASDFICACYPEMTGSLIGDKCSSVIFDNSKIRRFVPDYVATTPFAVGVARAVAAFDADPARRQVDQALDIKLDRLIAAYERGLAAAVQELR